MVSHGIISYIIHKACHETYKANLYVYTYMYTHVHYYIEYLTFYFHFHCSISWGRTHASFSIIIYYISLYSFSGAQVPLYSCISYHRSSCNAITISWHAISKHAMWYHIATCNIRLYHAMSCHMILYPIAYNVIVY